VTISDYLNIRQCVIDAGYDHEYKWAENIQPPKDSTDFFMEYMWVVLNSGMKEQIARKIQEKILNAIIAGQKINDVFHHKGKAKAIQDMIDNKNKIFEQFLGCTSEEDKLDFCRKLPWIGKITCYHLAKNVGVNIAKPDRWLERIAEKSGESVQGMCKRLSEESGDRITAVDTVIWRACNLGIIS
jgi:hypothetical protein